MHFEVQNFCFFCPCAGLVHFEVQNLDIFCPCAGFRQGVGLQSRPNLHRDKKNTSFELQSAPNLHRDKKNKSFELQSAPNLHRDKKNKKTKTSQSTWEGATIPLKFLFFLFLLSLCRFGAL